MSESYNTPGVPTPEDSARQQREATRALPDDTNVSPPAVYDQTIPGVRSLPRQVGQIAGGG